MFFKRAVLSVAAMAICSGVVFAQISIGGGGDVTLVPMQVVTRDTAEFRNNVWLGAGMGGAYGGMRIRLSVVGAHDDLFGFRTDLWFMYTNNQTNLYPGSNRNAVELRLGDFGHLWWRPLDWLRLDVGRMFNTSQTGYINDHWLSDWTLGMFDGQNIFSAHFGGNIGFLATFAPPQVEGLSLYLFVPHFGMPFTTVYQDLPWLHSGVLTPGGAAMNSDDPANNALRAFRVFQRTWVTVGYRFGGNGSGNMHARLQFIGANPSGRVSTTETRKNGDRVDLGPYGWRVLFNAPRFEAAFAYLVPDRLAVDFGVRAWLPVSDWITDRWHADIDNPGYIREMNTGTFWGGLGFALGVAVAITDSFVLNFRADTDMLRRWSGDDYDIGNNARVTNPMRMSFHLWPTYMLANGMQLTLSAGLNYTGRNTVDIDGRNPNDAADVRRYWNWSNRLRFGGGLAARIPIVGHSSVSVGLAYSHGTADIRGGEARTITLPVSFFFHW